MINNDEFNRCSRGNKADPPSACSCMGSTGPLLVDWTTVGYSMVCFDEEEVNQIEVQSNAEK